MSGLGNHHQMTPHPGEESHFIGRARTVHQYGLFAAGIPFFDPTVTVSHVHGEVYRVNQPMLKRLDRFENHPDWYYRTPVSVIVTGEGGNETVVEADVYANTLYGDSADLIESGSFRGYAATFQY